MCLHTHIQRRGTSGIYYIRRRIPNDLLPFFAPKKEIARSLKTKDPKEAKERGRLEAIKIDQQFAAAYRTLEQGQAHNAPSEAAPESGTSHPTTPPQASLTPLEIERLALLHLHTTLAEDEDARDNPKHPDALAEEQQEAQELAAQFGIKQTVARFGLTAKDAEAKRGQAELFLQAAPLFLASNDFSPVERIVDALLDAEGIDLDKAAPAYRKLCRAVFMAECKAHEAILKRMGGEWVATPAAQAARMPQGGYQNFTPSPAPISICAAPEQTPANPLATPSPDNPLFSEVWKRYLKERAPAHKTELDFAASVRRFIEVNGDLPIKAITKAHIRTFKDVMLKIPVIRELPKAVRTLPALRLIATMEKQYKGESYPTLSTKTVNEKLLATIKIIISYAVANGYIDNNPASGMRVINNRDNMSGPERLPYDMDDFNTILHSPLFVGAVDRRSMGILKQDKRHDYQWLTLLAMFTGARLEEIGQLDANDIYNDNGIWCIHIHADLETNRRVKNKGSIRKIPVHPKLIELGFIDFVQSLPPEGKLLRTITSRTDHRTSTFSKWWGRFTKEIGVHSKQKTFHSFRHTFKRTMRDVGANAEHVNAIQGHSDGGSASGQYGRDKDGMQYNMTTLMETMKKLKFEGVELDFLRGCVARKAI